MNLQETLKKFGLSEKEVDVYLALSTLGGAVVSDIAKKAGINRSTTYVILDSLTAKGLVRVIEESGVKLYSPTPRAEVIKKFEETAKQYSDLASAAKKVLPTIAPPPAPTAAGAASKTGTVQVFKGDAGMKTVYEDALGSLETIRAYASEKSAAEVMPKEYYDRLQAKKIKMRVLGQKVTNAADFSPNISIYGNKVVLTAPGEKLGVIIESPELAKALKKTFDTSWQEQKATGGALAGNLA